MRARHSPLKRENTNPPLFSKKLLTTLDNVPLVWYIILMNDEKNLPIEAEITAIRATAEEAKKLRADLQAKTTIIKQAIPPTKWRIPQGPMRLGGTWFV